MKLTKKKILNPTLAQFQYKIKQRESYSNIIQLTWWSKDREKIFENKFENKIDIKNLLT